MHTYKHMYSYKYVIKIVQNVVGLPTKDLIVFLVYSQQMKWAKFVFRTRIIYVIVKILPVFSKHLLCSEFVPNPTSSSS